MKLYVIRLYESKEAVAIGSAANDHDIFWLADRSADPHECEYAELEDFCAYWPQATGEFLAMDEYPPIEFGDWEPDLSGLTIETPQTLDWKPVPSIYKNDPS
jgi:hypothetical protein